jgi:GNAT superfamily N-acetyltransferase
METKMYDVGIVNDDLIIKSVDQETVIEAKNLIIKGLSEHFEYYDETKNPDLNNITEDYFQTGDVFLVALNKGKVIGTGALIKDENYICRIIRMSVDKEYRGKGIAKKIVTFLEKTAKDKNYKQIVLETNNDWYEAINLYKKCGYIEFRTDEESIHFIKEI